MTATSIRADGLDWPIDTYLDACGYRRLAPLEWPRLDVDERVETVTLAGELAPVRYAGDVRWFDMLAFRIEDAPRGRHAAAEAELAL